MRGVAWPREPARSRDYDNRLAENPGETLEYEKLRASLAGRYALNNHASVFASATWIDRDTNRETGSSFRDYEVLTFLVGVSATY